MMQLMEGVHVLHMAPIYHSPQLPLKSAIAMYLIPVAHLEQYSFTGGIAALGCPKQLETAGKKTE